MNINITKFVIMKVTLIMLLVFYNYVVWCIEITIPCFQYN